jgi:lambda repressor-like predicted transcriptional regulator
MPRHSHKRTGIARRKKRRAAIIFTLANGARLWQHVAMEKLKAYIAKEGISARAFAQRVGLSPSGLHGLMHKRNAPSLQVAFAIEDVTGGAVPARSWIEQ